MILTGCLVLVVLLVVTDWAVRHGVDDTWIGHALITAAWTAVLATVVAGLTVLWTAVFLALVP